MIRAVWRRGIKRGTPLDQPRHHPSRILCSASASASGWGAQQHLKQRAGTDGEGRRSRGQQSTEINVHNLPPSARLCTAAVRRPRNRDAQRHQYVGAWEGVAPVCRCVRQTAARKGKEGKGAFRPKAYWLSSRGGPARRHLSTLSAWGGVRCLPVKRPWTALINPPIPPPTRPTHADLSGV